MKINTVSVKTFLLPLQGVGGLGLSLSYDIVVKGHGGTISVVTQRCDFTEFIVSLPL